MKSTAFLAVLVAGVAFTTVAQAHFRLDKPKDALVTDTGGDPVDGDQKDAPCGSGKASNMVTQVKAGSKFHVELEETVAHGGHYRIAISKSRADFKDPKAVVSGGNCVSAPIESSPVAPVIADGLFVHEEDEFGSGKAWETDITIPTELCDNCTLQIIEFMTPHAPDCYYHHCANIQILAADADIPDEGKVITVDAGASSSSGSTSSGSTSSSSGSEEETSSSSGNTSSSGSVKKSSTPADEGCAVGSSPTGPSIATLGVIAAFVLSRLRRRNRR